jgi:uncharacterized protein YciI
MMLYTIMGEDKENSLEDRLANRTAHLERIKCLHSEGRLLLAGPHPLIDAENPGPAGFSGSLIVAEFVSLKAAKQWAKTDPYTVAGVFSKVSVKPFNKVLP